MLQIKNKFAYPKKAENYHPRSKASLPPLDHRLSVRVGCRSYHNFLALRRFPDGGL